MHHPEHAILKVVVKFSYLAPLISLVPLVIGLGPIILVFGIHIAFLVGAVPAALAGYFFSHTALVLKRWFKIYQIGRLTAIVIGVASGATAGTLAAVVAWLFLGGAIKDYALILYPSIFSGSICGLICRKAFNG